MATSLLVLGQVNPGATTATDLYTVPASTQTVISTLTVAEIGGAAATFRIAVRPAGATLAAQHYIAYDIALTANTMTAFTLGLTLDATDVITVYASTANVTFNAYGSEVSA